MAKLILSGDLSTFRIEMVVRILEAVKFDGEVSVEGVERGQIFMHQGKVVGAKGPMHQGLQALVPVVSQRSGTFAVRQMPADEVTRHPDLVAIADNATIFRQVHALAGQGRFATAGVASTGGSAPLTPPPAASATVPPAAQPARRGPQVSGPMGRVPELTDKGKMTLRSIQTNYAMRGVQVDADIWKILGKVDGNHSLFAISNELGIMGDRFNEAAEQLQREGYIRFQAHDPGLDHLTPEVVGQLFRLAL